MTGGTIAVIPARGGSKRIPRKNIREFCGKPMIAWSIEAARKSNLFNHVIVSTDDAEIAEVARWYRAEVPFVRPSELSDDHTGLADVVAHAIQWALSHQWDVDATCCILATAPMMEVDDLKRGLEVLRSDDWSYAFSATDFAAPIFRSFVQDPEGGITMVFPQYYSTRSQDLPIALHDAAQFYWGRASAWLEKKRVYDRSSVPIMIPRWRVQDIDTDEDWLRAELMFRTLKTAERAGR